MNVVDPLTGKIGERGQVLFGREPARLETPHLARRRRTSRGRFAADDPTHRRIMAQPFCVVDVLVSGQPSENGLPQHAHERVSAVLSGAGIREPFASHCAEAQRIIEFAVSEQTGSDVTTEPQNWSISRRSKSSLSASPFDSPVGFTMP